MALAFEGRGIARMNRRDFTLAVADLNKALELNSNLANSYANRGLIYLLQGKQPESQADFKRAIELDPEIKADLEVRIERVKMFRTVNAAALQRVR
jgi:tetratricopeptide (TPR) repeat protein